MVWDLFDKEVLEDLFSEEKMKKGTNLSLSLFSATIKKSGFCLFFGGSFFWGWWRGSGSSRFTGIAGPRFPIGSPEKFSATGFLISFSHSLIFFG